MSDISGEDYVPKLLTSVIFFTWIKYFSQLISILVYYPPKHFHYNTYNAASQAF